MTEVAGQSRGYGNILLANQGFTNGTVKISPAGLAWKARNGSRVQTVRSDDIKDFQWLRGARSQQLRVGLKGAAPVRFEGFRESDYKDLENFLLQAMRKNLKRAKQATKGWSWGHLDVDKSTASLLFRTGGGGDGLDDDQMEDAFEVPLGNVSNVQLPNKNELSLDMHVDDTAGREDEELVEMRFYVPEEENAEELHDQIRAQADTSAFAGESICSFRGIGIIVPRGRYDVDLYPNHVKLHGKSYDFKILYSSITRLFVLPKPDDVLIAVVVSLDPPIRQGNTMYAHLVFQFDRTEEAAVELAVSEKDLQEKYKGKLHEKEEGEAYIVFSKVLKHLSKSPLYMPKTFKSATGKQAVRTALGASEGYLFFLEMCFFFINKPPTYVRYDEIDFVEFKRMDLERRFDLSVSTSSGQTLLFSNIERDEFRIIFDFLEKKNVVIENAATLRETGGRAARFNLAEDGGEAEDSESDDDDFDPTRAAAVQKAEEEQDEQDEQEDSDEDDDDDDVGDVQMDKDEVMDLTTENGAEPPPPRKRQKT